MATPTTNTVPVFFGVSLTGNGLLDPLLSDVKWGTGIGTGVSLGYSFPDYLGAYEAGYGEGSAEEWTSGVTQLSFQQQGAFADALEEFENVANLSFYEVSETPTSVGEIRIAMTDSLRGPTFRQSGETTWGYAYYPSNDGTGGDIWLNPDEFRFQTIIPGNNDELYTTLLHEIGHALGLSHPFEVDLPGSGTLSASLDNMFYTVMTYTLDPSGNDFRPDREPTTLMLLDILAIQHLYGANTGYNAGDNTYSYSDSGEYLLTIWDGGGEDWISYSGASTGALIDLREGSYSTLGLPIYFDDFEAGGAYYDDRTVWIAFGTEIENAFGGAADDVIYGNALDNILDGDVGDDELNGLGGEDTLLGFTGNDTLKGGSGDDTAVYLGNRADYTVIDNEDGTWTVIDNVFSGPSSDEGTDRLEDIEYIEFNDTTELLINLPPSGSITITGTPREGETLGVSSTLNDPNGLGSFTYTWFVGGVDVSYPFSTLPLIQSDVGQTVMVTVTYTDGDGYSESVSSALTIPVENVNDDPFGQPSITGVVGGNASEGQTLIANIGTLGDQDGLGAISYTWLVNGVAASSGTTFTLTQNEVGKTITLRASYTDLWGTAESVLSDTTNPVINTNDAPTGSVLISGTATQGQTLTASNTLADEDGLGSISYTWKAGGSTVGTGSTLFLTQNEVGKNITVTASYTDLQGTFESRSSAATADVANVNDEPSGSVTISGSPVQGSELSVSDSLSDPDGLGTITYTWKANGAVVGTGSTFTPGQDEVGTTLVVTASYTDQQGTAESVDSNATASVSNVNDDPQGTVSISGTAEEDSQLSASNTLSDLDGLGTISYTWKANGAVVGTGMTFTPGQDEVGKTIVVTASYTDQQGTAESVDSDATASVANVNDDPTGAVSISGLAEQYQELMVSSTLADEDGLGSISYTWKADGTDVGSGMSFTLSQDEVGKIITVTATYTDQQGTVESVDSDPTAAVANVNDDVFGVLAIIGTPQQGQELSVSDGLEDTDGLGPRSYTWQANGIEVGSGETFTPGQDEVGKTITVTASYTDQQGTEELASSDPSDPVANVNDDPVGAVSISGTPEQGQLLSASNTLTDPDGLGSISYSWKADGSEVGTGETFTPGQDEVGKTITVTASYTDQLGTAESVDSAASDPVANVNDEPQGEVSISGSAVQDRELLAANTLTDLDGLGAISYSWKADGAVVGTGMAFTPGQDEVGKVITVTASYTDGQGTEESVESEPTSPVQNMNEAPTGAVTISGEAVQGATLTASNTLADTDGLGDISYRWKADGEEVGSGETYTPGQDDVGKLISVTASYTDQLGAEESVDSEATDPVANVNDEPAGTVSITGTPEQGQQLTATNTLSDLDGLGDITYTWMADGEAVAAEAGEEIPAQSEGNAVGATFTPGQDQVGKIITVIASYTDGFGASEAVESEGTDPVANVNDAPSGTVTISGDATEGQTLTAGNSLTDADGLGEISYRWKADAAEVGTGETYTPTQADVGKSITVSASYTDLQGTAETVESEPTSPIANSNNAPTGAVSITGSAVQGQTLTAGNTLGDLDGLGPINYRWSSGGADRGTGMSLLLTQEDVGRNVIVTASYTDLFGFMESVASAATSAVENINDLPTGEVTVSGAALVGETLMASNTLADADGLGDISYSWKADDATVGIGDSYLLTEAEVGKTITATAEYTDGGGVTEMVASAATTAVEPIDADPLFNEELFIALSDFIVTETLLRDVIGILPGTGAGEGVVQTFSIQNGAPAEDGEMKPGRFGEFFLDTETGEYRYVPNAEAIGGAGEYDSEVFVISAAADGATVFTAISVANFDNNEFIVSDPNNDGLLYDALLLPENGDPVSPADAQLYRTYAGALGRTPDVGGFDWWSDQIAQGLHNLNTMVAGFLWSDEFLGFFPGATRPDEISSADFINHMYQFVFGRDPDTGGFLFWTGQLDTGSRSQEQVVVEMTQSNEFVGLTSLAAVDFLIG